MIAEVAHLKNYPAKTLDRRTLGILRTNLLEWQTTIRRLINKHPKADLEEGFKDEIIEVAEALKEIEEALKISPA